MLSSLIAGRSTAENLSMAGTTTVICACCGAHPAVFAIGSTPVCETCADEL